MKKLLPLFLFVLGCCLSSCVQIPKKTEALAIMMGNQITESKISHLSLIDQWEKANKEKAEQFLEYEYAPDYVKKFVKKGSRPYELLKASLENKCEDEKADIVIAISREVTKIIEKKRAMLLKAIEEESQKVREVVIKNYEDMEMNHRLILSNIQSVVKGQDFDKQIREALSKQVEKIVPIGEVNKTLDKLLVIEEEK